MPDKPAGGKTLGIKKQYWYVIGGLVGVVVFYIVYERYKNSAATTAAENAAAAALAATPVTSSEPSTSAVGTTTTGSVGSLISTLADWSSSVQTWATTTLGSDPATVQNALQAYQNNECLTQSEYNIIDQALGAFGAPPNAPFTGLTLCSNAPSSATSITAPVGDTTGGQIGAGYRSPKGSLLVKDLLGNVYSEFQSATAYNAAIAAGQTVYFQPTPGVFEAVPAAIAKQITVAGNQYTNTPTFLLAQPAGSTAQPAGTAAT